MDKHCSGEHRIFVAEVVGVESQGKVVVITVCTDCDTVNFHEHQLSTPGVPIRLLKEEKKEKT